MTTRPYQRKSMSELESLLAASARNKAILPDLRDELKARSTQRAADLLQEVEQALAALELAKTDSQGSRPQVASGPAGQSGGATGGARPADKAEEGDRSDSSPPAMGTTEAAKILGVSITAKWEAVEKARRELVCSAVIGADVLAAAAAAKRVNSAYLALAAHRRF